MKRRPEQLSILEVAGMAGESAVKVYHKEGQLVPPGKLLLLMYTYNSDGIVTWCRHQVIDDTEVEDEKERWVGEKTPTRLV